MDENEFESYRGPEYEAPASPDQPIFPENGTGEPGFWRRNGATVITLAILGLIIGGAIAVNERRSTERDNENGVGAVTKDQNQDKQKEEDETKVVVIDGQKEKELGEVCSGTQDSALKPPNNKVRAATNGDLIEVSGEPATFKVTAARGEGRTHLARRAITKQLRATNIKLSNEQRVYAEDYLQKKHAPKTPLHPGSTITFSADQINEAISASQSLDSRQIQNLHQYSVLVNWPPI